MCAYLIRAIVYLIWCAIQINGLERDQNKRRRKSCHTKWIIHMVRLYATLTAVDSSTLLCFAPLCFVYLYTCRLCCLWFFFSIIICIFHLFWNSIENKNKKNFLFFFHLPLETNIWNSVYLAPVIVRLSIWIMRILKLVWINSWLVGYLFRNENINRTRKDIDLFQYKCLCRVCGFGFGFWGLGFEM